MTTFLAAGLPFTVASLAVLGLSRQQGTRPAEDPVATQRERNEAFFLSDYLERREMLVASHAGKWIAIVAGRVARGMAPGIRHEGSEGPSPFRLPDRGGGAGRL